MEHFFFKKSIPQNPIKKFQKFSSNFFFKICRFFHDFLKKNPQFFFQKFKHARKSRIDFRFEIRNSSIFCFTQTKKAEKMRVEKSESIQISIRQSKNATTKNHGRLVTFLLFTKKIAKNLCTPKPGLAFFQRFFHKIA